MVRCSGSPGYLKAAGSVDHAAASVGFVYGAHAALGDRPPRLPLRAYVSLRGGAPVADHSQTFAEFVTTRSRGLQRTAYLLTGDHHQAEDLVQAALIKAARVWPRIEARPDAYVRRILYHESISRWRRRRVTELSVEHPPEQRSPYVDPDARLDVMAALTQLTPKQRTVLVLRYLDDLTEVQTAHALGIGVGTVKSQTRQALDRLRKVAPHLSDLMTTAGNVS